MNSGTQGGADTLSVVSVRPAGMVDAGNVIDPDEELTALAVHVSAMPLGAALTTIAQARPVPIVVMSQPIHRSAKVEDVKP